MLLLLFLGNGSSDVVVTAAPTARYRGTVNIGEGVSPFISVTYQLYVTAVGTEMVRI